jgi:putative nucleotidyltransferase with HDIG domain
MTPQDRSDRDRIRFLHRSFGTYARRYVKEAGRVVWPVAVKVVHCQRVRENAQMLADDLSLSRGQRELSIAAGLYHDLGRFEQYRRYRTFRDQDSEDHGELSASILRKGVDEFLSIFSPVEQEHIIFAVRYHNRLHVPRAGSRQAEVLLRICRDADKLDIWRVFDDLLAGRITAGAETINHGMPEGKRVSKEVIEAVMAGRLVDYRSIESQIDFAVMRLSWVFDMNFSWTIRQVVERGYLNRIKDVIPKGSERDLIFQKVEGYIEQRLKEGA